MAPDAPPPVRNSLEEIVGGWTVTVRYDEAADVIFVTTRRPGTRWLKPAVLTATFEPVDLEDAISAVQVAMRTLGARRLF